MGELIDRWILPLAGGAVTQCCINHGLTIEVASNGAAAAPILISGAFELQSADGSWQLSPAGKAVDLASALVLLGLAVDYAAAHRDGTLAMVFADGIRFRVPPGAAYEAWEFNGNTGAKAFALPGGDIAIWRSAA